jgi:hypothetical protein
MEASADVSYRKQPVAFSCAMNVECCMSEWLAALCHWKGKLQVEMYMKSSEGGWVVGQHSGGTRWSGTYGASKSDISVLLCFVQTHKE